MSVKKPLAISIFLCCIVLVGHTQFVQKHGKLNVVGTQLMDEHHDPIVLRGMSYGWHNWWPRFYNAGTVNWLADDWHCTVVRAAMGIEPEGGYKTNPQLAREKILAVVDAAIKKGIYVIIDWHSHNINQEEAVAFFSEMASTYGEYPNVIYEIFNEPDQESWDDVKTYSRAVISAIRTKDPDNIILVGSPHWDQDLHTVAAAPLEGYTNIMYTLHFYAATHKQWLRDRADDALAKGIPIFISESAGMESSGNGPLNEEEWNKWIEWAEQHKISWITWSISDKDETCSVLKPRAASEGSWSEHDLKESGIKTRALLRKYLNAQ